MKKLTCIVLAVLFCAALFCTSLPAAPVWAAEVTESEDGGGAGKHETPPVEETSSVPEVSSEPESSLPVSSEEIPESQPESSTESTDPPSSDTESDPVSSEETSSEDLSSDTSSDTSSEDGTSSDENASSEFEFSSEEEVDPESETSANQNVSSGPPDWFVGEVISGASEIETSSVPSSSLEESSQASSDASSRTDGTVGVPSDLPSAPSSAVTTGKTEANNRFLLLFGLFLIITGFIGLIVFIVLQMRYNRRMKAESAALAAAEEAELMDAAMYGAGAAVYTETKPAADEDDYSEYAGAFVLSDAPEAANDFDAMSDEELDARLKEYEDNAKNTRVNGAVKGGKHSPRH